jgi:hypothetical protein
MRRIYENSFIMKRASTFMEILLHRGKARPEMCSPLSDEGAGSSSYLENDGDSSDSDDHPGVVETKKVRKAGVFHEDFDKMTDFGVLRRQAAGVELGNLPDEFQSDFLKDLKYHPSVYARLRGNDVPPTRAVHLRGGWHGFFEQLPTFHRFYTDFLANAGFDFFIRIRVSKFSKVMTHVLTERWFSETNTLHLPSFELGPTPLDWYMVTGLRFGGRQILVEPRSKAQAQQLCGFESGDFHYKRLKQSALRPYPGYYSSEPQSELERVHKCRRLVLLLLASFFPTENSKHPIDMVSVVEDLDELSTYDWGSFTFSSFLRGMRIRVSRPIGSLTGPTQFLTFWFWEYANVGRPRLNSSSRYAFPRASQWHDARFDGASNTFLGLRSSLDGLTVSGIDWNPYSSFPGPDLGAYERAWYLSQTRICFSGLTTWELYMGERCSRQIMGAFQAPSVPPAITFGAVSSLGLFFRKYDVPPGGIVSASFFQSEEGYDYWYKKASIGMLASSSLEAARREREYGEAVAQVISTSLFFLVLMLCFISAYL